MRRKSLSSAELARRGWKRSDPKPWRTKLDARYEHVDGWKLAHCGHPTAHHPYLLTDPLGRVVLTGAHFGRSRNPEFGTAFDTLRDASDYVRSLDRWERENGPRGFAGSAVKP